MRTAEDTCLLCEQNKATKQNSHIFPKFLSKKFLGDKTCKRGYEISSYSKLDKPEVVQDSPKEDHILCDECEIYLSILERLGSHTLNNWQQKVADGTFLKIQNTPESWVIECNDGNEPFVRLLAYSIFWRASISSAPLFQNVVLEPDLEEELRLILFKFKCTRQKELVELVEKSQHFESFLYFLITANEFENETKNLLFATEGGGVYQLYIDQFYFGLAKEPSETKRLFQLAGNLTINDCKIILFSRRLWDENVVQPVIDFAAKTKLNDK